MDAELARFVGGRGDDPARPGATDDDRLAAELRTPAQLDRDEERVHVDVEDDPRRRHDDILPADPVPHPECLRRWRRPFMSCNQRRATSRNASLTMLLSSFDSPTLRSRNVIGNSTILPSA